MKQFCVIREPRLAFGTPFIQKLCCTPFHSSQLQEIFSTSGFVRRNSCFSSTKVGRVRNLAACSSCQQKQNVFTPHWKVLEAVPLTTSYFFEGYYFRITIPELNESFSFIYALERKSCGWVYTAQVLNEEGLLFHTFKNSQFWRHEDTFGMGQWQFDDRKEQEDIGIPRQLHPSVFFRKVPLGFQWTRRYHCGRLLDDKDSSFSCSWNIDITALDGWGSRGRNPQKSTASWLSHIPYLFDPGYQVLMAHGLSNGWLQWKGRSFPILDCPVYIEKNWGQRFPKKWFWLQCNSFFSEKDLSVTSVGAIRRVLFTPNGEETVGMLSIHHRGRHYLFTNWTCFYITWQVAPWGSWSVYAESSQYVAILRAWCDSPGQIVLGPSLNGLQPNTRESLFGHMRIQITEKSTQCKVVEDYSNFAAVEVGGQDKSCWRNIWTDSVFQLPLVLRNVVQYFDESSFETLLLMTARLKLLRRALLDKYSTKINAQVKSESTGHMDEHGNISMVDVSNKEASVRSATAEAKVLVGETVSNKLTETTSWKQSGVLETTKGNLFTVAQIAGIQAAKRTSEWIPLCHPLSLQHVDIQLSLDREKHSITIRSTVKTKAQTGVEMEALTAVTASALTVYDMCKSWSKSISIQDIQLLRKSGGKSGLFEREGVGNKERENNV